jgi:hypothetical protein
MKEGVGERRLNCSRESCTWRRTDSVEATAFLGLQGLSCKAASASRNLRRRLLRYNGDRHQKDTHFFCSQKKNRIHHTTPVTACNTCEVRIVCNSSYSCEYLSSGSAPVQEPSHLKNISHNRQLLRSE